LGHFQAAPAARKEKGRRRSHNTALLNFPLPSSHTSLRVNSAARRAPPHSSTRFSFTRSVLPITAYSLPVIPPFEIVTDMQPVRVLRPRAPVGVDGALAIVALKIHCQEGERARLSREPRNNFMNNCWNLKTEGLAVIYSIKRTCWEWAVGVQVHRAVTNQTSEKVCASAVKVLLKWNWQPAVLRVLEFRRMPESPSELILCFRAVKESFQIG
jgi:hypothetical protein